MLLQKITSRKKIGENFSASPEGRIATDLDEKTKNLLDEICGEISGENFSNEKKRPDAVGTESNLLGQENLSVVEKCDPCEKCWCTVFWSSVYEPQKFRCADCDPWPFVESVVAKRRMVVEEPRRWVPVGPRLEVIEDGLDDGRGDGEAVNAAEFSEIVLQGRRDQEPWKILTRAPQGLRDGLKWLLASFGS